MSDNKAKTSGSQTGRRRTKIDLDIKMEIISRHAGGQTLSEIARELHYPFSTVSTIVKNAPRIKKYVEESAPIGTAIITKRRSGAVCEMEKQLNQWIRDNLEAEVSVSPAMIRSKARSIYSELKGKYPDTVYDFHASDGWYSRFKKRIGFDDLQKRARGDTEAAEEFVKTLNKTIENDGYTKQQIFNVGETGLFWKKMPSNLFKGGKSMLGYKASKDRMTLMFGCNTAGSCKLKPLLIYHSENPRSLKEISKTELPVFYVSDVRPWVTESVFQDWFDNCFVTDVSKYCQENNIPFKILLILDKLRGSPVEIIKPHPNVNVVFLPPKTASLIQPMDQGVIASIKAYYTRATLVQAISSLNGNPAVTLRDFWKSYNLYDAVYNVKNAWEVVSESVCSHAWSKICPFFDLPSDAGKGGDLENIVKEVIKFGKELSLDVDVNAVEDFIGDDSMNGEMTEYEENHEEEMMDSDETEEKPNIETDFELQDMEQGFQAIEDGLAKFQAMDPDLSRFMEVQHSVEEALACYRKIYEENKKKAFFSLLN